MYGLVPIDFIKLNKQKLAEIYNCSDIDAIEYMYPFCEGEWKELCERIYSLNMETDVGWGKEPSTPEEVDEYYIGKWKLLHHFGIQLDDNGEACVEYLGNNPNTVNVMWH